MPTSVFPYIQSDFPTEVCVAELIFELLKYPPEYKVVVGVQNGPIGHIMTAPLKTAWCNTSQVILGGVMEK